MLLISLALGAANAQNLPVTDFEDEDALLGIWDWWGGAEKTIAWDSEDAEGVVDNGSLKLTIGFDNALDDNQYAIGLALAGGSQWNTAVMASSEDYATLAFDIRWNDESTASLDAYNTGAGDPGFFVGVATADWGQTWLQGVELAEGGWQHVEIPIPAGTPDFPGIIFKKWSPGGGEDTGLTGTASISIDNIQLLESGGGNPVAGETVLLNGFDDDLSAAGFWMWWGGTFQEFFWVEDQDAEGSDDSGAVRLSFEFDSTLDDNQYSIGYSLSGIGQYDGSVVASAADYAALAFDIKWDPASTVPLDDYNDNGMGDTGFHMGFAPPDWTQSWITNAPFVTEEWQRVMIPIDPATPDFAGLVFKKWQPSGEGSLNGTASMWIDNISLVRLEEAAPPPAISIESAAPEGLRLVASASGQQYQRQNIMSFDAEETVWFDNPNPVTYLIEFADFPGADFPGFQAHLFIVPDSGGGGSPDWSDPNVIFIQFGSDGTNGQCTMRYKVDEPNGNTMIFGDGTLGTHIASSILGTWSITFENNTEVTITAPDESSATYFMPEGDAERFEPDGVMNTYFGIQPNQLANIGQSATFSRISIIDGGTVVLDDKFETVDETQKVDIDRWLVEANAEAVWVINSDAAYWLNWTLPAPNFELFSSPNLGLEDEWMPVVPESVQIGAMRTTLMQGEYLPAADEAYFRLQFVEPPVEEIPEE